MRNRLQASLESPLLLLMLPLCAGLFLGLCFYSGILSFRFILLLSLLLTLGSVWYVHVKWSRTPFSSWNKKIYFVLVGYTFCCLGMLHGAQSMQNLEPPFHDGNQELTAIILQKPSEKEKTLACLIQSEGYSHQFLLYIPKDSIGHTFSTGDFIQVKAHWQKPQRFTDEFDYGLYLKTQDITLTGFVNQGNVLSTKPFHLPLYTQIKIKAMKTRDKLSLIVDKHLNSKDSRAIVHALLLGDKNILSSNQKEAYSKAGASHLLALSGMHISFIVLLLNLLTLWCPKPIRRIISIFGTWSFIFLVGLPLSAVRAGLMLTLLLLNPFNNQRTMAMDRWLLAALIMVLYRPVYLLDTGFQLSFAAVAGILLFMPFWNRKSKLPSFLQNGIAICLCAQLAVLPLSLFHFHTFPVYFLLTNILVSLVLTPFIIYASICLLVFQAFPLLGKSVSWILEYLLTIQQAIIDFIQGLPGGQITLSTFNLGALISSYLVILMLLKYLIKRDSKSIIQGEMAIVCFLLCFLLKI